MLKVSAFMARWAPGVRKAGGPRPAASYRGARRNAAKAARREAIRGAKGRSA